MTRSRLDMELRRAALFDGFLNGSSIGCEDKVGDRGCGTYPLKCPGTLRVEYLVRSTLPGSRSIRVDLGVLSEKLKTLGSSDMCLSCRPSVCRAMA